MKSKKSQAEFSWIFSLIIGAVILFLAIFAASKIFTTSEYLTETEIMRTFETLLNPFSSLGTIATLSLSKEIRMPYEAEMNISCSFDSQKFSIRKAEKNKFGEWTSAYTIKNKYIFSEEISRGKKFQVFSKAFRLPWRVDDMIYIVSKSYCFIEAPDKISTELKIINSSSIKVIDDPNSNEASRCDGANVLNVCFKHETLPCNINVDYSHHSVSKPDGITYYFLDDASMYAAIFSSGENYDCNMKRLLSRISLQTEILKTETGILSGCLMNSQAFVYALDNFRNRASAVVSEKSFPSLSNAYVNGPDGLIKTAERLRDLDKSNLNCPIIND
jgi:hypothetical protein